MLLFSKVLWISPYSCSRSSPENSQNSPSSFSTSPPLSQTSLSLPVPLFCSPHQQVWETPTTLMGSHASGQLSTYQLMHGKVPPLFFHICHAKGEGKEKKTSRAPLTSKGVYNITWAKQENVRILCGPHVNYYVIFI